MDLPSGLRLSFEDKPSWDDREVVDEALGEYNAPFLRDPSYEYFGLFVRDEAGAIRAGLVGNTYAGWLFVNLLWVHAELRRKGIGSGLIAEAERRAIGFGWKLARAISRALTAIPTPVRILGQIAN